MDRGGKATNRPIGKSIFGRLKKEELIIVWILIFSIAVIGLARYYGVIVTTGEAKGLPVHIKAQCNDRIDNDKDGYCDYLTRHTKCNDGSKPGDKECRSSNDNKEAPDCIPSSEVCDGFDNNCNGLIDEHLPVKCGSASNCGNSGWSGSPYCGSDGNVHRNWINYKCSSPGKCSSSCSSENIDNIYATCSYGCLNGECLKAQCDDGKDNDGDTYIDYPADLGCTSASDNNELGTVQCDDGIDNDGDGLIDYPKDSGCTGILDNSEFNIYCGDGTCNGNETCRTCSADCGVCAGGVNFKTYKGLNLPWGINDAGGSTFNTWFVPSSNPNPYASVGYHEQSLSKAFDHINSMGVKTVGIWLWFDRMLVKDSNWGTDAYKTQFNSSVKANWESFLKNVIKPKDMELIVRLFPGTGGAEREPYKIDWNTFVPVFAGNDLLGAGVRNGDMLTDANPQDNFPDGWNTTANKRYYSYENNDGTPGSPPKYLKIVAGNIRLTSPKIPYTNNGALLAFSATYKGDIKMFYTDYYDSSDNPLGRDWVNRWGLLREGGNDNDSGGYSETWTTVTWAGRTVNIPAGTAKIAITAETKAGTTYIGPVRIAPGARSAKWRNYMQAVRDWVSLYGSNTEYGPEVASWQGIKEVSDGGMFFVTRDFSKDFYQAIKSTGTAQPVGIDNSPYVKLPVTDPANLPWYNDAADYYNLHMYKDDGAIPDVSKLDKPFIIGELGASWNVCVSGVMPPCPEGEGVRLYDMNSDYDLNAVRNFYTNGKTAGAKTVMAWSWNDNGNIAGQNYVNKTLVLNYGKVGQWIKDWNP